jgi:hypothetical protein
MPRPDLVRNGFCPHKARREKTDLSSDAERNALGGPSLTGPVSVNFLGASWM